MIKGIRVNLPHTELAEKACLRRTLSVWMDRSTKNESSAIIYLNLFNDHIVVTIANHGHNATNWQREVCVTYKGFEIIL